MGTCCVVISAITHISFFFPPPKDREQEYRRQLLQPHGARAEDAFTPSDPFSALIPVAVLGQAYSTHSKCPHTTSAAIGLRELGARKKK